MIDRAGNELMIVEQLTSMNWECGFSPLTTGSPILSEFAWGIRKREIKSQSPKEIWAGGR